MKTFLVTGCSGELGRRLVRNLASKDTFVYGIRGQRKCEIESEYHICESQNLLSESATFDFRTTRIDELVHLAWFTTPGTYAESPINVDWEKASMRLIKDFIYSGGNRVISAGSCAEYEWSEDGTNHDNMNPATQYGKSKLSLFKSIEAMGIDYLWVRTFFQYGMDEQAGRLIPTLIDSIKANKNFRIRNPEDILDFVFIDDVANLYLKLIKNEQFGIVDIGTFTGTSVREVAEKIGIEMGKSKLVTYSASQKVKLKITPNERTINSIVADHNFISLDEALKKTIKSRIATTGDISI